MIEADRLAVLRHIRPVHLGTTLVLYLLGSGIARYLGNRLDLGVLFLGLAWLVFIQLGFFTLGDRFLTPFDPGLFRRPEGKHLPQAAGSPDILLFSSLALLAGGAVLGVLLGLRGNLTSASLLVMSLYPLLYLLLVVPGISLDLSGVGEFLSSIILIAYPPALAFLLQTGEFHRFLPLSVFPLFALHLAMIIVLRLRSYPEDLADKRKTLLVRLGWVQGVFIHNALVFSGFLLFGLAILFGMPFAIIAPVFLALPVGAVLVWYLSSLEKGAPVRWPLIVLLSLAVFFLPAYLVTYAVWIR